MAHRNAQGDSQRVSEDRGWCFRGQVARRPADSPGRDARLVKNPDEPTVAAILADELAGKRPRPGHGMRAVRSPPVVWPSGVSVPPAQHPKRAEGVPAARRAHALEIEVDAARMDAVQQPPAVGLPFGLHDRDRLGHPGIGVRAGVPEVVQRAQHVVVPVVRERKLHIPPAARQPCLRNYIYPYIRFSVLS